jgi:homocysteine S-methyltransferase
MSTYRFIQLLEGERPILSDGAMGTMLNQRNVSFEECFDNLNIEKPALVAEVHREYIEAGSQIIQTNTYGANRYKLARFGLEENVAEINRAGVELARRVILASFSDVLVAGDVGPLGVRLAPFGRVLPEQAFEVFKEQIAALLDAGVDLIIIETITDLYEIREAIRACRTLNADIPIIASMTYTRDDRTLLGDSPAKVARKLQEYGADILGVNCSGGPSQILRVLKQMHQTVPDGKFSAMPNAGWPEHMSGRIMYPASPDYFSDYALAFWEAGAKVIGGCCGTTPQHIAVMNKAIQSADLVNYHNGLTQTVVEEEETAPALQPTQLAVKLARKEFVFAVEMDPPRGLTTNKLLAGASLLAEAGADVINVADSPMARMRMSPWAVCSLVQKQVGIETVLHFPTRGRNLLRVQGDLLAAHAMGVRNVFVVMGDPTAIGDYPDAMDNYDLVPSGLIKLIKQRFNAGVDHAGADIGQPTTFFVGCALNLAPSNFDDEIKNLNRKIRAGADFCLTQPIYDPHTLETFLDRYQSISGELPIPLIVGILPLVNYRHAEFLHHEVPGIVIPDKIRERMQKAGENSTKAGTQIAVELIEKIKPIINGVYIMPAFSRFDYVAEIIESVSNKG